MSTQAGQRGVLWGPHSNSINIINDCINFFGLRLPSEFISKRKEKYNDFCKQNTNRLLNRAILFSKL